MAQPIKNCMFLGKCVAHEGCLFFNEDYHEKDVGAKANKRYCKIVQLIEALTRHFK